MNFRKESSSRFSAVAIAAVLWMLTSAQSATFYVSTNGRDSWSGEHEKPNLLRTDGPFATVPRALKAVREWRSGPRKESSAHIVIRKGSYFLKEPLVLKPEDSGLSISGEGTLSGGVRITNWFGGSLNGRAALIAEVPTNFVFHQLWVNGRRATRARMPNTNYFAIESAPATDAWQKGQGQFTFRAGDLPKFDRPDPETEVIAMSKWVESHLPLTSMDETSRVLHFGRRSVFQLVANDPFYVEGVIEAVDATGEWFLDSRRGTLYYLPREGEAPETLEAIAPRLSQLLRFEGTADHERTNGVITDITISGLTFAHTEWRLPPPVVKDGELPPGGGVQAAFNVPGAIHAAFLQNSILQNCTFEHLGNYGLELAAGCVSNLIDKCTFEDLGAGGIKLGETEIRGSSNHTHGNTVRDCRIANGGKVFHSAVGVWVGQSYDNTLLHNEISNFYYTGISIGWTWGYGPALATNNLVLNNHVHDIGRKSNGDGPILSDMGGIYTLGRQPGTRIINNVWHDISASGYGGWGIYFDEGSSGILAISNLVYRTTHGGFHQHYGASNMVWNNVFAFSRDHQLQRTRVEEHQSFSFQTNIVVIDHGVFFNGDWSRNLQGGQNIFYDSRADGLTRQSFEGKSFSEWSLKPPHTPSFFLDPLLGNLDIEPLVPLKVLKPVEFQPIDTTRAR